MRYFKKLAFLAAATCIGSTSYAQKTAYKIDQSLLNIKEGVAVTETKFGDVKKFAVSNTEASTSDMLYLKYKIGEDETLALVVKDLNGDKTYDESEIIQFTANSRDKNGFISRHVMTQQSSGDYHIIENKKSLINPNGRIVYGDHQTLYGESERVPDQNLLKNPSASKYFQYKN